MLNERLGAARDEAERREGDVVEVQAQLAARAAAVEELTESRSELGRELMRAQEDGRRWQEEAARSGRGATSLEADVSSAEREVQLLKRRVQVKEVHVTQLTTENGALAEQLRALQEHLDTPESMLREVRLLPAAREGGRAPRPLRPLRPCAHARARPARAQMLRMTETELKLKTQLSHEKEMRMAKQV